MSLRISPLTIVAALSTIVTSMALPTEFAARSPDPTVQLNCYPNSECVGPYQELFYQDGSEGSTDGMCILASDCNCVVVTAINNAHFNYGASTDCDIGFGTFNDDCNVIYPGYGNVTIQTPGANSFSFYDGCNEV